MISNQVLPIQFLWLLVASTFSVLANAIQHDNDSGYYDQENHYHSSDENIIEDDHKPAAYSYQYQAHPHTGDYKTQHEERIGDTVRGMYSLIEPDGTRRIVKYTVDPLHGFKAVVKREPRTGHLQHNSPAPIEIIQPKPISKPPTIPSPTPIRPSHPGKLNSPKLFQSVPQPTRPTYYYTTSPKSKSVPNKYSYFRSHQRSFTS